MAPLRTKRNYMNKKLDFSDPFIAGQMVGMLVMLTFIEKNGGIPAEMLDKLKQATANNAQQYLQQPTEDIFLMVNNMVEDIAAL
jgi:hypothetical protein